MSPADPVLPIEAALYDGVASENNIDWRAQPEWWVAQYRAQRRIADSTRLTIWRMWYLRIEDAMRVYAAERLLDDPRPPSNLASDSKAYRGIVREQIVKNGFTELGAPEPRMIYSLDEYWRMFDKPRLLSTIPDLTRFDEVIAGLVARGVAPVDIMLRARHCFQLRTLNQRYPADYSTLGQLFISYDARGEGDLRSLTIAMMEMLSSSAQWGVVTSRIAGRHVYNAYRKHGGCPTPWSWKQILSAKSMDAVSYLAVLTNDVAAFNTLEQCCAETIHRINYNWCFETAVTEYLMYGRLLANSLDICIERAHPEYFMHHKELVPKIAAHPTLHEWASLNMHFAKKYC